MLITLRKECWQKREKARFLLRKRMENGIMFKKSIIVGLIPKEHFYKIKMWRSNLCKMVTVQVVFTQIAVQRRVKV